MVKNMKPETIQAITSNHHYLYAFNAAFNNRTGITREHAPLSKRI